VHDPAPGIALHEEHDPGRRGRLETMIGPKGVRALRWFARLTLVQPPKQPAD
jgi:hypothetical protein